MAASAPSCGGVCFEREMRVKKGGLGRACGVVALEQRALLELSGAAESAEEEVEGCVHVHDDAGLKVGPIRA